MTSEEEMVRVCAVPNCGNRMRKYKNLHFHRLPFHDLEILQLWLVVLQLDVQTPIRVQRTKDYRICSEHHQTLDVLVPNNAYGGPVLDKL